MGDFRGFDVHDEDFVAVLDAFPDEPATIRAWLLGEFGILVDNLPVQATVYGPAYQMWTAIEFDRGEAGAADVVAELVLTKGGKRVNELVRRAAEEREIYVRADDSKLARLLFQGEDEWHDPEIGRYIVDYFERTRPFLEEEEVEEEGDWEDDGVVDEEPEGGIEQDGDELEDEEDHGDEDDGEFDLLKLFSGKPRPSAAHDSHWSLVRVQTPARAFLAAPRGWSEADLEEFLWLNWERIDFGLDRPIHLVGRQERLRAGTSDRVDLVARGAGGEWIAIELKIEQAGRSAFGQLLSYMADLERSGKAKAKVRGILIAPDFSAKVLNAASTEPRVALLRFEWGQ